jgi:hypothetical protein
MSPIDLKKLISSRSRGDRDTGGAEAKRPAAPKIVTDLYADLRDSHMLLPAALLLVAIVALPFLLGGGTEPVPPPPPPAVDEATATRVAPAVLAKQTGIRDYEERLELLQKKNPFKQQYQLPEPDSEVPVDDSGTSPDPSVSLGTGTEPTGTAPTGSPAVSLDPTTGTSPSPSPSPSATPTPSTGPTPSPNQPPTLFTFRIDISVGPMGKVERRNDVSRLEPLPSKREPVAVFLGVSENGKRASFLLSADVVKTEGDGVCLRAEDGPCEVLTMKPGDNRYFTVGQREERFRLKLNEIVVHEKPLNSDHPVAAGDRPK